MPPPGRKPSLWRNGIGPNPFPINYFLDEKKYLSLEKSGMLRVYVVRTEGKLVGYCVYLVSLGSLHSMTTKRASNTDLWLMPEHRKGFTGIKLIKFAEDSLRAEGVVLMTTAVMENSHAAMKILEYLGHKRTEVTFTKVLTERRYDA